MKKISEILKHKRMHSKLLLREVSSLTKIDQSILSKFENGERMPSKEHLLIFAKIYGISKEELIVALESDRIVCELANEKDAIKILNVAKTKLKNFKIKR